MRLLFLSNFYPPLELGGMEQLCYEVAEHLRQRDHDVWVLTSRHGTHPGMSTEDSVRRSLHLQADIEYYHPSDFFLRRTRRERDNAHELRRAIDELRPDLIVVWGMWNLSRNLPHWAEQWMAARVAYAVASYWLVEPDAHEAYWQKPARRACARTLMAPARWLALRRLAQERQAHPLALEQVACVSEYVRRKLGEAGALPRGARVIYNGIDPVPFLGASASPSRRQKGMRLIYTGGILPHKGVHTAVEALGLLQQQGEADGLDLMLVGGGHHDYEVRLKQLITELDLAEHVTLRGQVPREQIPALLSESDVFLFTSVWEEPIARSVMEAMAAGLAVIATRVGGQAEMLEDGANALVFPAEDADGLAACIVQLSRDPDLRTRLSKAGQRTVLERFTLARMVDQMEAWLESIVQ